MENVQHDKKECAKSVAAVKDALYVLNGKWKMPLIMALTDGEMRFKDLQRTLGEITPKILSKELKEMELNKFVERIVKPTTPVTITYKLTPYSRSLEKVMQELKDWGLQHRKEIMTKKRNLPYEE